MGSRGLGFQAGWGHRKKKAFSAAPVFWLWSSSRLPALGHWEHPDSCAYRLVLPGELPSAHTYPTLEQPSLGQLQTQTQPQLVTVPNGFTVLIGKPGARLGGGVGVGAGRGQAELPWD